MNETKVSTGLADLIHDAAEVLRLRGAGSLSLEDIVKIMGSPRAAEKYAGWLLACMDRYGIDTPLRIAHFLAQVGHESGGYRYVEELASGEAYEGRADLGNTEPGDGVRFKGRGLIQITGRANYAAYGKAVNRDVLGHPEILADDPQRAADSAGWYWSTRGLNKYADLDDIVTVTKRINGGLNGIEDRRRRLGVAKYVLGIEVAPDVKK